MPKLKVYGLTFVAPQNWECETSQARVIVAAINQANAVAALQRHGLGSITVHFLRTYASVSSNEEEIAIATAKSNTVFFSPDRYTTKKDWREAPLR